MSQTIKLSDPDTKLLRFTRQHLDAIFSGVLSTIVMKSDYKVTDHTKFQLNPELTEVTVEELEEDKAEEVVKKAK